MFACYTITFYSHEYTIKYEKYIYGELKESCYRDLKNCDVISQSTVYCIKYYYDFLIDKIDNTLFNVNFTLNLYVKAGSDNIVYNLYSTINNCDNSIFTSNYINWKNDHLTMNFLTMFIDDILMDYYYKLRSSKKFQGETKMILSSHFSSVLFHEIVGHCLEKDVFEKLSLPNNLFADQISVCTFDESEVDCILNSDIINNEYLLQNMIVRKGKVVELFDNYENGIIRQGNLLIMPSSDISEEKMIKEMVEGVYLKVPTYGKLNRNRTVEVGISVGYYIRNGKIMNSISNTKVFFDVCDFFKNIEEIGNNLVIDLGLCYKYKKAKILYMGGVNMVVRGRINE